MSPRPMLLFHRCEHSDPERGDDIPSGHPVGPAGVQGCPQGRLNLFPISCAVGEIRGMVQRGGKRGGGGCRGGEGTPVRTEAVGSSCPQTHTSFPTQPSVCRNGSNRVTVSAHTEENKPPECVINTVWVRRESESSSDTN